MYLDQKSYDGKVRLMDVTSPEFIKNPYKFYRERREADYVIQVHQNVWSIGSYNLMYKILSHPEFGRNEARIEDLGIEIEKIYQANPILLIIRDWMLFKNPPNHTRIRKLVQRAFTPKKIRSLESMMKNQMRKLIKVIKEKENNEFDVVTSISYPFPVSVISEMMGIPEEDKHLFKKWSTDFAIALAMDVTNLPEQVRDRLNASAKELITYFEKLIETKKDNLSDDLVSTLISAELENDQLTIAEILSNCTLLLVAGHETTTSLISNGINLLLDYPEQFEILKRRPNLIENAVEEFLRFDPPVQSVGRMALNDVEIDGYKFNKGDFTSMMLGGAGRDPEANPNPEKFDIERAEIKHVSFGKGIHYCLGANLARFEAKIAFEMILQEFPNLQRSGTAERSNNWLLRGFKSLPVKF